MKKINIFLLIVLLLYVLTFISFKYVGYYSKYKLVSIQNDFIIVEYNKERIKLFPKEKFNDITVNRILFSYAVINKKEYRVGDTIIIKNSRKIIEN